MNFNQLNYKESMDIGFSWGEYRFKFFIENAEWEGVTTIIKDIE